MNLNKAIYIFVQDIYQVTYWNYVGVTGFVYFPLLTIVDRVMGVDTTFTENIVIDTSFVSGSIPGPQGNISPILTGISDSSISLTTTYIPLDESIQVIIDFFNLIHHSEFLERVLIHFGLEEPNSILDENADQPITFYLHQNYPNPFNPITSIQYAVSSRQFVSLKVYDVLGNEIASLVDEEKPVGSYEIKFDGTGLTSGIYFYQLKAGSYIKTKKMVLIK
ncbi:MAG: T9SS type A sorting domain-containing protein [Bacteroidetes bacterium]|nr:T9SS type A sorting domain-containing protein [Bacteroidota bacterium]